MLLVRGLRCDARQRCLRLDGHITLFYVNNAERLTQKRRSEWMTYVYGWVLRMQSKWESVASTRLIPYWEESSATYGIMDLDITTPLYNTLHHLVANSIEQWRFLVRHRHWTHLSFSIPLSRSARAVVERAALLDELNLSLEVVCDRCGRQMTLQRVLECDTCDELVCYNGCSIITSVSVPYPPYVIGRQNCIRCAREDSDFEDALQGNDFLRRGSIL